MALPGSPGPLWHGEHPLPAGQDPRQGPGLDPGVAEQFEFPGVKGPGSWLASLCSNEELPVHSHRTVSCRLPSVMPITLSYLAVSSDIFKADAFVSFTGLF